MRRSTRFVRANSTAAVEFLAKQPWFNGRFVIAGTSEGAVAVARYVRAEAAPAEAGRIIFSWSCENNYHVVQHKTRIPDGMPVLNIMSSKDKYFSQANPYLGNHEAVGNCSKALQGNPNARIVLIKDAPHTLMTSLRLARPRTSSSRTSSSSSRRPDSTQSVMAHGPAAGFMPPAGLFVLRFVDFRSPSN